MGIKPLGWVAESNNTPLPKMFTTDQSLVEVWDNQYDGGLKSYTVIPVIESPNDGRPMHTDTFLDKMIDMNMDHYDFKDGLKAWLEGDWVEAMSYLEEIDD